MAFGAVGYLWAAGTFLIVGKGTPAPAAPPREFVTDGPYRYVRNPMYLSGLLLIAGEALLLQTTVLLAYGALLCAGFHAFVVLYEEPVLRRRHGAAYESYCRAVSRWRPGSPWPHERGSG
jgi:protein-S-isoprenylcysteine O-methyltransferase Ste14